MTFTAVACVVAFVIIFVLWFALIIGNLRYDIRSLSAHQDGLSVRIGQVAQDQRHMQAEIDDIAAVAEDLNPGVTIPHRGTIS